MFCLGNRVVVKSFAGGNQSNQKRLFFFVLLPLVILSFFMLWFLFGWRLNLFKRMKKQKLQTG